MRPASFVSQELVDHLKKTFPNTVPGLDVPMKKVRAMAGEQRVIAHIEKLLRDSTRKSLLGGGDTDVVAQSAREE
jgi:hypothetical protein